MEIHLFYECIKYPERLEGNTLEELRNLVLRYPYFQTAWVLYLKNLFLLNHPSFKDELRRGALYVADLSILFYFIEGNKFAVSKHDVSYDVCSNDKSDRTLDIIDRFLSELSGKDSFNSELPLPVEPASDYTSVLLQEDNDGMSGLPLPMKGQELIDSFIEKSDFGKSDELLEEIGVSADAGIEIPKSRNINEDSCKDLSSAFSISDTSDEEEYLTETLAKIYVKQRRYDKALEIIKKLYLKYPKKNIYFADQIRFLEKLIINAKSK